MLGRFKGFYKHGLIKYGVPLTFSLTLVNYNRANNNESSQIDLEDETIVTDSNAMEYQLNEIHPKLISGTFRSEFLSYIFQQWEQNKTVSQIFHDLYNKYPTAITEFSLMIGGGMISLFGFYYGRQRLRSRWFDKNFYNTINISLNTFDIVSIPQTQKIPKYFSSINFDVRTICHSQIHDLIPNPEGAKYLMQTATDQVKSCQISWIQRLFGADKNKPIDPILKLDHSSHFICYRLLRNAISEISAPYFIARDINNCLDNDINIKRMENSSLLSEKYLLAICVEEEKWNKIHVVLIKKKNIEWLIDNIDDTLDENDWGLLLNNKDDISENWKEIRWNTVMCIAKEYEKQLNDEQNLPYNDFAEIEMVSPKYFNQTSAMIEKKEKLI